MGRSVVFAFLCRVAWLGCSLGNFSDGLLGSFLGGGPFSPDWMGQLGSTYEPTGERRLGLFAFCIHYDSMQPLIPFIFSMTPILWSIASIP